ncbi:PucR family transcriptional regulator [Halobacillus halophilus]|uniref:PucR family transcription regulator n=1 Tax=Halobacillus halophilus (strain ATCC 35676 / DSM 2266 / JCM 20832 / KCTC 3685 / LMG 17431 / NBRC 102448 / NCIMB 2269) TaxID=866895 RepID=I0JSZ3_HALH3|nr:PucR family transcriptional regulator [Halobacillus halophilus]ASF41186.1 PucR family transcriptional regulator [Halobacillus halophilus]CCG47265.1 PucR family transcription regulator [Halobacillus halophilus DSM 2266]
MGVTVENVLRLPIFEQAKVLTKITDKPVQWISVIETPVENFVRNNEFVLSTGVGCGDDVTALEEYVKDVIRADASALAFATGRYLYKIPDRILKIAEEHNFMIMEIPWEVRFGDILHDVLRLISEEKQTGQQRAETIRQELINCVLNGKGLQEITTILYDNTHIPAAISDHNKQIRANQQFDRYFLDVLNGKENEAFQLVSPEPFSDHPLVHYIEKYEIGPHFCYQLTILSNYKKQGYLLFKPEEDHELSWVDLSILEHTLTACALYFVKENAIEMTEIRLKDNFLLELAKTEVDIDKSLLAKAHLLGYDLEKPYVCLVGDIRFKKQIDGPVGSEEHSVQSSSMHSRNYYIQKEVTHAGDVLKRQTMTTFDEGEVIVYIEADANTYPETANQFLDLVERRLHELLAGITISWGVSCHKDGLYNFHQSYEEAATALNIGRQKHEDGDRTFFSDTRMNRLLMALSHEKEIEFIVQNTLEKLIEYDQRRQTDLIHTFIVYNKYNSNVSQTARALNLHRQSLLHRLRNIEQLTGLSLLDADDLFLLELSVRLWMLKKIEK